MSAEQVVHIVEIRLDEDDEWTFNNVYVHPILKSQALTVCDIANKVGAHTHSHGDTYTRTTTRTLKGNLVAAEMRVAHNDGESFFRHLIYAAQEPGPWLNRKTSTPSTTDTTTNEGHDDDH